MYYLFNEDGSGQYVVDNVIMSMTYEIINNSLFIAVGNTNSRKENTFKIENNILTINNGVGDITFIKE